MPDGMRLALQGRKVLCQVVDEFAGYFNHVEDDRCWLSLSAGLTKPHLLKLLRVLIRLGSCRRGRYQTTPDIQQNCFNAAIGACLVIAEQSIALECSVVGAIDQHRVRLISGTGST